MSNTRYNVGDKVVVLRDIMGIPKGSIVEVRSVYSDNRIDSIWDINKSDFWYVYDTEVVLVQHNPKPIKKLRKKCKKLERDNRALKEVLHLLTGLDFDEKN